jgi:hypothetical protein
MQLQILDPQNAIRCREYAEYRAKLSRNPEGTALDHWNTEYVQMGCLATVFAAHWYQQHEFLIIDIRLRSEFSTLRHDISPDSIIITNEDSQFPALHIHRTGEVSALYHAYRADFDLSFNSHKPAIKAKSDVRLPAKKDQVTEEQVFQVLKDVGIDDHTLNGLSMSEIRNLAMMPKNPYF